MRRLEESRRQCRQHSQHDQCRESRQRRERDAGISTVEVVFLTPLLIIMIMIIASLGVMVNTNGEVNAAARDAARAGSLQATRAVADGQADLAARADLGGRCTAGLTVTPGYRAATADDPDAYYVVTVDCRVDMTHFGMIGVKTISARFTAPIDPLQNSHLGGP